MVSERAASGLERVTEQVETVADAYLALLAARGVEYLFGNGGTDFAPIVDALARRLSQGLPCPQPVTVPHEFVAVSMAHGYYLATGRPQSVMVHVTVGSANALGAVMNAARLNVPMLMSAGRTPLTEEGLPGSRDNYIHWAQESFDQGSIMREFVKWDYELRSFPQLETVVDRALAIAQSDPAGPVYLTLPREVLSQRQSEFSYSRAARLRPARAALPDPGLVRQAASLLASAAHPLVITDRLGRHPEGVAILERLAERFALPVVTPSAPYVSFPTTHPMHMGYGGGALLAEADALLVIESDVPWFPSRERPPAGTPVVQVGADPLNARYPVRGFPVDIPLTGDPVAALRALEAALEEELKGLSPGQRSAMEHRFADLKGRHDRQLQNADAAAEACRADRPIDMRWLSQCVNAVRDERTVVINEYTWQAPHARVQRPGELYRSSPAAALGWGLGAALGYKLGSPDSTVIATVGDGSYMFGAPTPAHWVARRYGLPILVVVFNNSAWNAVKNATRNVFPEGWAQRSGSYPFVDLDPSPAFELVGQASGGYGERVEDPADLPDALQRGLAAVREGRAALLNVICKHA